MNRNINPNQICLLDPLQDRGIFRERESSGIHHIFKDIISVDNLLISWREFLRGKRRRKDVAEFEIHFMDNVLELHRDLFEKTYRHGNYQSFKINDPKPRDIHKACVKDRLVHHAIYRILYPKFDKKFIFDSYSCRVGKGTHKAIGRFKYFGRAVSKNNTQTCWLLKCDIRKFFANIDHQILEDILEKHITDKDALYLLSKIIESFNNNNGRTRGLPLGNLTSQLLVNIYMNKFDQFIKRELKVKYYIRYADDFVVFSENKKYLEKLQTEIQIFLNEKLKLELHPNKIFIKTLHSGLDFLGWVHFSYHRTLRTSTKRKVLRKFKNKLSQESKASYSGLLSHGNTKKLVFEIFNN